MAHDHQFTATGPSNVGSGFPRAAFSDNNQSGQAPQDFVGGVNVEGGQFGVYGECLPSGAIANAPTDRVPPLFTGVSGRGLRVGTWGEGPIAGLVGTSLRDKDPNLKTNTVFVGCLAGLQNENNKNSAVLGVLAQGSMFGVMGTAGAGFLPPPTLAFNDGVLGITGVSPTPATYGPPTISFSNFGSLSDATPAAADKVLTLPRLQAREIACSVSGWPTA